MLHLTRQIFSMKITGERDFREQRLPTGYELPK